MDRFDMVCHGPDQGVTLPGGGLSVARARPVARGAWVSPGGAALAPGCPEA